MNYVIPFLKGLLIGTADVIPGVSGGTMALILGIYERFISAIALWTKRQTWQYLLKGKWQKLWKQMDGEFIVPVAIGILSAGLTLASVLSNLLETQPLAVWSLFFGLVAASAISFMFKIKQWNTVKVCVLVISGLLTWILLDLSPTTTPNAPWFLFLAGLVAICGMLLPGISGAFILLILGKYQFLVDAVHERRFGDLVPIILGIIVGILCFSRVLKYLLKQYHDQTLSVMIGLLIGSLKILWPGEHLTGNPESSGWMIVMIGVGAALVFGLEKVAGVKEVAEV